MLKAARCGSSVLLLLCAFSPLYAAGENVALAGCVRDPSGAVVPHASLLIWNRETGLSRTTETDDGGGYSFRSLPPGLYELGVSAPGFRRLTRTGIRLSLSERAALDVTLQIGRVEDTIVVHADEEGTQTSSGSLHGLIDRDRVESLPLSERDVTLLVMTQASAIQKETSVAEGTGYVVNGSRQHGVGYLLDGGTNTDSYRHQSGLFPNPAAIAEVSVERSSLSAEYGSSTGAVVSVTTRSGTNDVHASLFGFVRNSGLNARNFFSTSRDISRRLQSGASVGGPIVHNRLFYFVNYQATRGRAEVEQTRQMLPTAAMRAGDLSQTGHTVADPLNGQPFPGGRIPLSRFSPVSSALLPYIALPTAGSAERIVSITDRAGSDEFTAHITFDARTHRLAGRIFENRLGRPYSGNPQDLASMFSATAGRSEQAYTQATLNDTWSIGGSTVNTATLTVRRRRTFYDWRGVHLPTDLASAGVRGLVVKQPGLMYLNVSGYFLARPGWNYDKVDRDFSISDSFARAIGRHEVKAGADLLRIRNAIRNDFRTMGNFDFTGSASGDAMADFLLGAVYQFWQGGGEYKELGGHTGGVFAQDVWRATNSLTLTAGLRWEPYAPFRDALGRTQCFVPGIGSVRFPNAPVGYLNAGDPACPAGGFNAYSRAFSPRAGLAWRPPASRFVIRAGAGLFWSPPFTMLYNGFVNSAPFSPQVTLKDVRFENPYASAANPFPRSFAPFSPSRDAAFDLPLGQFGTFAPGFRPGYAENLHLTVERTVAHLWQARTSYVASLGRQLSYSYDANYAVYAPGATVANLQQRRPYTDFTSVVLAASGSNSSYHGLEASLLRRSAEAGTVEVSYTWSKAIDEYSEESRPGQSSSIAIPYDRRAGRSVANFDITHQLVASWVWRVPACQRGALLRTLSESWTVSGWLTAWTGQPFSVRSGTDRSLSGVGQDFADVVGNPNFAGDRSQAAQLARYFDTTAFQAAAPGTFGNSPRNFLRGPGGVRLDAGLARELPLGDRLRARLRAEFFNALNHAVFAAPYSTLSSPTRFGRIERAGDPRTVQLSLQAAF